MTLTWYGIVDATGSLHACFKSRSLARSVAARWGPGYRAVAVAFTVALAEPARARDQDAA